jgi:ABC-2 type transport system ATP-binding protein
VLEVFDVVFGYSADHRIINQLSLEIADGEIVGLLGPNGAGKSTLIKLLFDLLEVESGSILIAGASHRTLAAKQQIMYLSSEDQLPDFLRGSEYLNLLGKLYSHPVMSEPRMAELFSCFGMSGRQHDLIEDYSHGMRKKVQLIAAFEIQPPLIIIDETMNGIDLDARRQCIKEFDRLKANGNTVILCSHDFSLLEDIASRALVLVGGRIIDEIDLVQVKHDGTRLSNLVEEIIYPGVGQ